MSLHLGRLSSLAILQILFTNAGPAIASTTNDLLFYGEWNNLIGIGGEQFLNLNLSGDDPLTPGFDPDGSFSDPDGAGPLPEHFIQRIDVGDRLVGIGATLEVECDSCSPPEVARSLPGLVPIKSALRAFEVISKIPNPDGGYSFTFGPLTPDEFSNTVSNVSNGAVSIPSSSIPVGSMIISYDGPLPDFTLMTIPGSPGSNYASAVTDERLWNVGIGSQDDFWAASFPTDNIGLAAYLPSTAILGNISFGLSLLPGSEPLHLQKGSCSGPMGTTSVDFCLSGVATGTSDLDTPFPIGLSTEIKMAPAVPGPMPILGSLWAFAFSRKLRSRIQRNNNSLLTRSGIISHEIPT